DWANENVVIGYNAASQIISSSANTMIGYLAGSMVQQDYGNTFIGSSAGSSYIGSGSDGYNTTLGVNTVVDNFIIGSTAIGQSSRVCDNNTIVLGSGTNGANEVVVMGNCKAVNGAIGDLEIVGPSGSGTNGLWADGVWYGSDVRIKKDLEQIEGALKIINKLNGYTYFYKDSSELGFSKTGEKQAGLLAQELLEYFPYGVKKGATGYFGVDYHHLIPLLLEGIKEQQSQIDDLKKMFANQPIVNPELEDLKNQLPIGKLNQNNPNPFSENTEIKFEILTNYKFAEIRIYDLGGNLRLNSNVTEQQALVIDGHKLDPGIYAYTLIVDGVSVDTKTLVVAK
ncbi:MAG: tail fiber domain-containing protein, partial [Flavobacteriales bacterium]|nr:tail fiber domain-containing protein [Flavobacteriales bacterium]